MRDFIEPSMRNLLRRPLVLGVPVQGLLALSVGTVSLSIVLGSEVWGNAATVGLGLGGYLALRVAQRFSVVGWEESLLFPIEYQLLKRKRHQSALKHPALNRLEVLAPETATESDFITQKDALLERLTRLQKGELLTLRGRMTNMGLSLEEIRFPAGAARSDFRQRLGFAARALDGARYIYTLKQLPVYTDPVWLDGLISRMQGPVQIWVSIRGLDSAFTRKRLELVRRSSAQGDAALRDIDAEVTFEETSQVLQGLSRGDEAVVELSLVITAQGHQALDPEYFHTEKKRALPMLSVLGLRPRFHRSHWVRAVTASDLIPSVGDPDQYGCKILRTQRGVPLAFDPQDSRLEALHWLVSGASGSGKSFFTGLVLKRLSQAGAPMSVIFIDHNRSFRRVVKSAHRHFYFEPENALELKETAPLLLDACNRPGNLVGFELSDLALGQKREAAQFLLSQIEAFLRNRATSHPVYVVLDECWNFLKDDSVLIQRAFREFRKLNGAVIAITQSLHDFLQDPTGQSIFQNAPVRIILRQGEDLEKHRGVLGLNDVELERARRLRQVRGEFSECLIKTPFLSRVGRLYPTPEEYSLLRTDNLREEWIAEHQSRRKGAAPCESTLSRWN
jgi:hypothetical protein